MKRNKTAAPPIDIPAIAPGDRVAAAAAADVVAEDVAELVVLVVVGSVVGLTLLGQKALVAVLAGAVFAPLGPKST